MNKLTDYLRWFALLDFDKWGNIEYNHPVYTHNHAEEMKHETEVLAAFNELYDGLGPDVLCGWVNRDLRFMSCSREVPYGIIDSLGFAGSNTGLVYAFCLMVAPFILRCTRRDFVKIVQSKFARDDDNMEQGESTCGNMSRDAAATKIQAVQRGRSARKATVGMEKQRAAAKKEEKKRAIQIQKDKVKEEENEKKRTAAATKIQAVQRGGSARTARRQR